MQFKNETTMADIRIRSTQRNLIENGEIWEATLQEHLKLEDDPENLKKEIIERIDRIDRITNIDSSYYLG